MLQIVGWVGWGKLSFQCLRPFGPQTKMLKCDDGVIGRNTASMHRCFRPEEGFLCCMLAVRANGLYYLRSLKYTDKESAFIADELGISKVISLFNGKPNH
jgi:hypothetical protein